MGIFGGGSQSSDSNSQGINNSAALSIQSQAQYGVTPQGYASSLAPIMAQEGQSLQDMSSFAMAPTMQASPFVGNAYQATNQLMATLGLPSYNADGTQSSNADGSNISQLLQNTPGYQFQMQQGTDQIMKQRALQGLSQSGGTMMALDKYGQGLASQTLGAYQGQLQNVINTGMSGIQAGAAGASTASNNATSIDNQSGQALINALQHISDSWTQGPITSVTGSTGQAVNQLTSTSSGTQNSNIGSTIAGSLLGGLFG